MSGLAAAQPEFLTSLWPEPTVAVCARRRRGVRRGRQIDTEDGYAIGAQPNRRVPILEHAGRVVLPDPPLGYSSGGKGNLVPNAGMQATIIRIGELHRDGASLRQIAGTINSEGRTPARGATWYPATVARVRQRSVRD